MLTLPPFSQGLLRRKSRQPQIENSNEMHDIHCAIIVFMAEGHIALAGGNELVWLARPSLPSPKRPGD